MVAALTAEEIKGRAVVGQAEAIKTLKAKDFYLVDPNRKGVSQVWRYSEEIGGEVKYIEYTFRNAHDPLDQGETVKLRKAIEDAAQLKLKKAEADARPKPYALPHMLEEKFAASETPDGTLTLWIKETPAVYIAGSFKKTPNAAADLQREADNLKLAEAAVLRQLEEAGKFDIRVEDKGDALHITQPDMQPDTDIFPIRIGKKDPAFAVTYQQQLSNAKDKAKDIAAERFVDVAEALERAGLGYKPVPQKDAEAASKFIIRDFAPGAQVDIPTYGEEIISRETVRNIKHQLEGFLKKGVFASRVSNAEAAAEKSQGL